MTPLERIKGQRGMPSKLARALGIKPQAVFDWVRVPPKRVIAVEQFTGISRHELRPDIYPIEKPTRGNPNGKAKRNTKRRS